MFEYFELNDKRGPLIGLIEEAHLLELIHSIE